MDVQIKELNFMCTWSRKLCVIKLEDICYILPRSYLLLIHNKLCDYMSVLILTSMSSPNVYNVNSVIEIVADFMSELISYAIKYNQNFFHLSKVLEGLVIGETLVEIEGHKNRAFLMTGGISSRKTRDRLWSSVVFIFNSAINSALCAKVLTNFSV